MKLTFPHLLSVCAAALAVLDRAHPAQQKSLVGMDAHFKQDKVPGHNDAIYDTFLEVAPTPIDADRMFFVYLRGYLPEPKNQPALLDEGLVNATLTVSSFAVYLDGSHDDEQSVIIPFKTTPFNDIAHLTIRDASGTQVDYMPSSDQSDVLLDFQIPTMFLKSGIWTFKVDARLGDKDNTCLFAMSLTQWLDGRL
ncbi:hypothetical protein BJX63DRAFT_439397 [Aspergillus granulosus]|uniref:Uncharacterized protein n=1 Tax=Aspergillus granulosus TaxID=176169 RepID=A0ABR4GZD7_9EURO